MSTPRLAMFQLARYACPAAGLLSPDPVSLPARSHEEHGVVKATCAPTPGATFCQPKDHLGGHYKRQPGSSSVAEGLGVQAVRGGFDVA